MNRPLKVALVLSLVFATSCSGSKSMLSIQVKEGTELPSLVVTGNTVTAYFTITNNTSTTRSNIFIRTFPDNVTQVTSDGTYDDTCPALATLAAHGQCTLQLTASGAVSSAQRLVACLENSLYCTQTNAISVRELSSVAITPESANLSMGDTQQFTATGTFADESTEDVSSSVTWTSSDEAVATISEAGLATALASGTSDITAQVGSFTSEAATLEVTPTLAYIANISTNAVSLCTIEAEMEELTDCTDSGAGAAFSSPVGLHFSLDGAFFYVMNDGNDTVTVCTVDASDGRLSNCAATGSGFDQPNAMDMNTAGTKAYVANMAAGNVLVCAVNSDDGTLSDCAATGGDSDILTSNDISLNGSDTHAYIADRNSHSVFLCSINASTGLFDSCADSGAGAVFSNTSNITFNADGNLAYVHNDGAITLCQVDATTGAFSACTDAGSDPIAGLSKFTLNAAGTKMYLTSAFGFFEFVSMVTVCDVDATTGALSNCADAAGDDSAEFFLPTGIVLK